MEHLSSIISQKDKQPKPSPKQCSHCTAKIEYRMTSIGWYAQRLCPACVEKEEIKEITDQEKEARTILGLSPRFEKSSFENFNKESQPLAFSTAKEYAEKFSSKTKKGLYLFGHPGSGKTHLAAAIANKLLHEVKMRFITSPELLLDIRKSFSPNGPHDKETLLDRLSKTNLIIIDDLGSEKPTEWVQETLFVLIDRRYANFLPTIITSNCSLDELKDRLGYRIASRIAEMCEVVELKASDYRIRKPK